MNKVATGFFISIVVFLSLFSCKAFKQNAAGQEEAYIFDNALLWKVEGKDIKEPSYIFGTIHLIKNEDFFLPPGFEKAFEGVQEVIFELDMKQIEDPFVMMSIFPKLMMKGDTSLKDLLSKEDYDILQKRIDKYGLPSFLLDKIKPMFLSMLVENDMDYASLHQQYKSYEMELLKMAEEKGKKTGGLETLEYQISVFDSIPYKEQAAMLMDAIKADEEKQDQMRDLIMSYKNQDIGALYNSIHSDSVSVYEDLLVNNRNKNWVPLMIKYMEEKPVMFAVGAGHLAGKYGVLTLLKKRGYKVTPVSGK